MYYLLTVWINKKKTLFATYYLSNIWWILFTWPSLRNIILGAHFLLLIIFDNLNFLTTLFSKTMSNFWWLLFNWQQDWLFNVLVVDFGPKGRPGRIETVQDFLIKLDIKPLMHQSVISIFRLFPIISICQNFFSFFFLTLEKIGIDEKVICYHNISN